MPGRFRQPGVRFIPSLRWITGLRPIANHADRSSRGSLNGVGALPFFLTIGVALTAIAGLSDFLGGTAILLGRRLVSRWFHYLLAYGTGFALALALGELIPSGLEHGRENALWALAGFCVAYLVDKLLESAHDEETTERGLFTGTGLTIVGVSVCSFFDGVAVAAATRAGESGGIVGWLLLIGLIPHKLIEGSDVTLLMLSAAMARRVIWLLIGGISIATLLGGIAVEAAVPPALEASAQAFAGGLLLHLVASERIPGFSGPLEKVQASLVVVGVVTFVLTRLVLLSAGVDR